MRFGFKIEFWDLTPPSDLGIVRRILSYGNRGMGEVWNNEEKILESFLLLFDNRVQSLQFLETFLISSINFRSILAFLFLPAHIIRDFLLQGPQSLPFLDRFSSFPINQHKPVQVDGLASKASLSRTSSRCSRMYLASSIEWPKIPNSFKYYHQLLLKSTHSTHRSVPRLRSGW